MFPGNVTYFESEEYIDLANKKVIKHQKVMHNAPQSQFAHQLTNIDIPMKFWEMLHEFSLFLLVDDKHDIGRFTYYNRDDHYYHFKHSPHHPTPFHHWQVGVVGLFVSQMGALVSKAMEMKREFAAGVPQTEYQKPIKVIDLIQFPDNHSVVEVAPPSLPSPNLFDKINHALDLI